MAQILCWCLLQGILGALLSAPGTASAAAQQGQVIAYGGPVFNGYYPAMDLPASVSSGVWAVSAGGHSMAIVGPKRQVVEWPPMNYTWWGPAPNPSSYRLPPKNLVNVTAISAGEHHSLALKPGGKVVMWSRRLYGNSSDNVPRAVARGRVKAIAAGRAGFSMYLLQNGTVVEWPKRNYTRDFYRPPPPEGIHRARAIAVGTSHNLALLENGTVIAWGVSKGFGNNNKPVNVPANLTNVVAIAAGNQHSLALLRNGTVVAWGSPLYNAQGATCAALSCVRPALPPAGPNGVPAIALSGVTAIAAGGDYAMALLPGGKVFVWGKSGSSLYIHNIPQVAQSGVFAFSASSMHYLALKSV